MTSVLSFRKWARAFYRGRGWRWSLLRLFVLLSFLLVLPVGLVLTYMTAMPGNGTPLVVSEQPQGEDDLQRDLRTTIEHLAITIGERNMATSNTLEQSAVYLEQQLAGAGLQAQRHPYQVDGTTVTNLVAEFPGTGNPEQIVVIGAHYDSVFQSPGADDNASGTAAVLALARASFGAKPAKRTLRFVFFVNEEAPYAMTPRMGSYVYASSCRARGEIIVAMFSMESIGYFTDAPNSQQYPSPAFKALYPTTGNFITFVGDTASRPLVRRALQAFRQDATVPSEGAALPRTLPGVGWSDHWSFWVQGYHAVMVTGTAPFRNPNYHTAGDLPETLDYKRMAGVVTGMKSVISEIANEP